MYVSKIRKRSSRYMMMIQCSSLSQKETNRQTNIYESLFMSLADKASLQKCCGLPLSSTVNDSFIDSSIHLLFCDNKHTSFPSMRLSLSLVGSSVTSFLLCMRCMYVYRHVYLSMCVCTCFMFPWTLSLSGGTLLRTLINHPQHG